MTRSPVRVTRSTGKERDAETSLDYFGARYYASAMGRFLNPDPVTMNALRLVNPQRWNKYSYVINNPVDILAFVVLAVLPAIPLFTTWQRVRDDGSVEAAVSLLRIRFEAILTTVSFILLLSGLIWSPVLGPDYSKRRFAMIYANLVVVAVVCVASFLGSRRYKLPLSVASCIVALEWIYLAVINSVV